MTSPVTPSRGVRRAAGIRTVVAVLTVVTGIAVVACTAPPKATTAAEAATSTTSTVVDAGTGPTTITKSLRTVEVAGGFNQPVAMVNRPMRNQLWLVERPGYVRVVMLETDWNLETGQTQRGGYKTYPYPVVDIAGDVSTDGERGVLGIAFSTDARTLYMSWVNRKGEIVVASWNVTDPPPPPVTTLPPPPVDPTAPSTSAAPTTTRPNASTTSTTALRSQIPPPVVDTGSRRVLFTIPHDGNTNYGGQLALGRDGYLYIGVGDSTKGSNDRSAQNTDSLIGKILRVDAGAANYAAAYAIPPTNPYEGGGGAAPVFLLGVQNPLRFSFDRSNGDLWIGDAGAGRTQEIDWLPASQGGGRGANLGWPYVEGSKDPANDAPSKLTAPILAFEAQSDGCAVIGGYVYRGAAIPDLQGVYVYGDRCSGTVSGLLQRRGRVLDKKPLGPQVGANTLASFGQDDQGELYVLLSNGSLQRLVAA